MNQLKTVALLGLLTKSAEFPSHGRSREGMISLPTTN